MCFVMVDAKLYFSAFTDSYNLVIFSSLVSLSMQMDYMILLLGFSPDSVPMQTLTPEKLWVHNRVCSYLCILKTVFYLCSSEENFWC